MMQSEIPMMPSTPLSPDDSSQPMVVPKTNPSQKYVHVTLFLLSPLLGWIYAPMLLVCYVLGFGFAEVTAYHLHQDQFMAVAVLITYFFSAPISIVLMFLDFNDENQKQVVIAFHRYAPIATTLSM
eukprot:PhF_6_TR37094/c0_g1_i1/m.54428